VARPDIAPRRDADVGRLVLHDRPQRRSLRGSLRRLQAPAGAALRLRVRLALDARPVLGADVRSR
jgi:hypothetical protein